MYKAYRHSLYYFFCILYLLSKHADYASTNYASTNSLYNFRCMNSPDEISAHSWEYIWFLSRLRLTVQGINLTTAAALNTIPWTLSYMEPSDFPKSELLLCSQGFFFLLKEHLKDGQVVSVAEGRPRISGQAASALASAASQRGDQPCLIPDPGSQILPSALRAHKEQRSPSFTRTRNRS